MATSCGDVDSDADVDIERRNREATWGCDVDDEVKGCVDMTLMMTSILKSMMAFHAMSGGHTGL